MNETLAEVAARIVRESPIDLGGTVSMMPLLQLMVTETGVAKDTAALYLTVAIRNAKKEAKATKPMVIDDHTPAEQFDA